MYEVTANQDCREETLYLETFLKCLIPHREIVFKFHIIYNSVSRLFCKDKSVVRSFLDIKTIGTIYYAAHIEFNGLFRIILVEEQKL